MGCQVTVSPIPESVSGLDLLDRAKIFIKACRWHYLCPVYFTVVPVPSSRPPEGATMPGYRLFFAGCWGIYQPFFAPLALTGKSVSP